MMAASESAAMICNTDKQGMSQYEGESINRYEAYSGMRDTHGAIVACRREGRGLGYLQLRAFRVVRRRAGESIEESSCPGKVIYTFQFRTPPRRWAASCAAVMLAPKNSEAGASMRAPSEYMANSQV